MVFGNSIRAAIRMAEGVRRAAPVLLLVGTLFVGAAVWLTTSARANHWVWKGWERMFGPASINSGAPHVLAQLGRSGNYTITAIDEPSAGTSAMEGTLVTAVNASGAMTGGYSAAVGIVHGFVDANGTFTSFDAPNAGSSPQPGYFQGTLGTGIDTAGDVAGVYADSNNAYHGFLRSATGTITVLDDPNAPTSTSSRGTFPMGIDDSGQIVGFYTTGTYNTASLYHGFLYSVASKTFTEIDDPNAGTGEYDNNNKEGTVPTAINASGVVTGYYTDSAGTNHGFIYSAGNYTSFDAPGAAATGHSGLSSGTVPVSIDTNGDIVGSYTDSNQVRHGFILPAGATRATSFDAPGADTTTTSGSIGGTFPTRIDPTGTYVTGMYTDSSSLGHGFAYYLPLTTGSSFITFTPPNETTSTSGIPIQGAVLGVNASGTVVGFYLDSGEVAHGFVYTTTAIPTPPPTFSPAQGTYGSTQTVTISDANPTATIYYTTDGSTPSPGQGTTAQYTGPLMVSATETIEAIAAASGYANSSVATATYVLNLPGRTPAPTPQFSPGGGTYATAQTVTITDSASGASIYYTLDGSVPTQVSTPYTTPVAVSTSSVLQAIAIAPNYAPSDIASASYQITGTNSPRYVYNYAGSGQPGYNGDGILATQADLGGLSFATAMDSAGNLYIADSYNNRIRMVSASTGLISTIAGTGTAGYSGDNGQATSAKLNSPDGVAVYSGNLYIADSGNGLIRVVNLTSKVITTYSGVVVSGVPKPGCAAGAAGVGAMVFPRGVAFDGSGNLYAADEVCEVVWKVAAGTQAVTVFAGEIEKYGYNGDEIPATSAELANPWSVALDSSGNVYIADFGNERVREVLVGSGDEIVTVAGNGSYSLSGDGGLATQAGIASPWTIAVDSAKNLYLSSFFSIRFVSAAAGIISTLAGGSSGTTISDDGAPPSENAVYASSLFAGANGNLYFFDGYRNRLRMVSAPAPAPTTTAATPVISLSSGTYASPQTVTLSDATPGATIYFTLDGSTPTGTSPMYHGSLVITGTSTLNAIALAPGYLFSEPAIAAYTITPAPSTVISTIGTSESIDGLANEGCFGGVALDKANDIYVTDPCLQTVYEISASTGKATLFAGNGQSGGAGDGGPAINAEIAITGSSGIALDSLGNVYIADTYNNRVRVINAQTGVITTFAGTEVAGYSGDGGAATSAKLNEPEGLAFDAQGNLYIADSNNDIVRMVSAQTGDISTVAGTPQSDGYSGDGGLATSAALEAPQAVALDSAGNLYIGDLGYRIREVAKSTGAIATIAGNGDYGATGDGGSALNAQIVPGFMVTDAQGNLYLSDVGAGVREISATTGNISTVVGDGYEAYWGDDGPPTNAALFFPAGIAFDSAGDLIVADSDNENIREVAPAVATPTFSPAAGSYTGTQTVNISDATTGAKIYYTTNGDTPTTSSTVYSEPITVSSTETIQAIAVLGYNTSGLGSAAYTINGVQQVATPTFLPVAGTYTSAQTVTISDATAGATIYYTTNGTTPTTNSTVYTSPITVSSSETIEAIAAASGYSNSAVASAAYTINIPVAATPTFLPVAGTYTSAQTVTISDATTGATIYYTTNGTTPTTNSTVYTSPITVSSSETIEAIAAASGYSNSAVASAAYTINIPVAATPTFLPVAGTYTSAQTVTISDATTGATIYYTTNGTTPTTSSAVYNGPITVSSSETIEAIAIATGYTNSAVASATYTINIPVAAIPTFSPAAGNYTSAQSVAIYDTTTGATIYYTTDGTTPTTGSTVYSGSNPIAVNSSETIKAIAVAGGYTNSAVGSAAYTISGSFSAPGGSSSESISIQPGAETGNTATISVVALNGFSGTVNLTCAITPTAANDPPTCSLSPTSVTLSGTTAQSSTLTVNTTAATSSYNQPLFWRRAGGVAFALVLFFAMPRRRRNWLTMVILLAIVVAGGAMGCGGKSSKSGGNSGTSAGTYTVTVTGTSGSNSATITTVTLTVQ